MSEIMPHDSLWPYSERNGVGVEADVAILLAPPEIELQGDDRLAVQRFAQDLFDGNLPDFMRSGEGGSEDSRYCDQTLGGIHKTSVATKMRSYYAGYFESPVGGGEAFGGPMQIDERKLASNSLAWYKSELTARLAGDPEQDADRPDSLVLSEHTDPEALLNKFEALQRYRSFYREVSRELRQQPPSDLRTVRQTLLNVYRSRVNSMTAELYPVMADTADWLDGQPATEETGALRQRLAEAAPIAANVYGKQEAERREYIASLAWRMDYIRNGAGHHPDGRGITPVSPELAQLADELQFNPQAQEAPVPQLPAETIEQMRNTRWKAPQLKEFLDTVLREWGLLSDEQADWETVDERQGAADDGKWQVVITSAAGSLEVKSNKKIMVVPEKFDRSLTQVTAAGALPVAAHELAHVWQAEFDAELAKQVPLAEVKGSKYITNREMGGIHEERAVHDILGQSRPTNVTYVRAMQAKVNGGNHTQVARAYAEAHGGKTPAARASAAGKNVMRLYRYGRRGGHDSQALDYAEQELILRGLGSLPEEQMNAVVMASGSFSLRDIVVLHRAGLLELPQQPPKRTSGEVMRIYLERFHDK